MSHSREPNPMGGLDLLLTSVAATLALLFIPMIFEFSGGSLGRVALLASMLIPPMLGIGWVQYREHLPVRVPRRRR